MKRLANLLRRALKVKEPLSLLSVPVAPEWTPEDATRWKQFLQSPTGQSLLTRARAMEVGLCVNACAGKHEPKMAGGVSFAFNWLERMADAETITSASLAKDATTEDSTQRDAVFSPETLYSPI